VGRKLLILGEPGSGKTTSLLALTRDLLAQAETNPLRPVPVVLNLSSWTLPYTTLDDWLAAELSAQYQIPKKTGQGLLAERRLLPLLDVLDELSAQRRATCVEAINRFTQDRLVGSVVCCCLKEYIDLPARLSLNAAICLLPLSDEQVQRYLAAAGERLAGLHGLLQRDSAMRIEARSPWMLRLMSRAYQDVPADQLLSEGAASAAARRMQLMDAYVAHMFRRAARRRGG
jgi:DNA polymerase III delta prime subunit